MGFLRFSCNHTLKMSDIEEIKDKDIGGGTGLYPVETGGTTDEEDVKIDVHTHLCRLA